MRIGPLPLSIGLLCVAGCGTAPHDLDAARACVPGESVACACTDGRSGAQVCVGDGSGFGACSCESDTGMPSDAADASGTTDAADADAFGGPGYDLTRHYTVPELHAAYRVQSDTTGLSIVYVTPDPRPVYTNCVDVAPQVQFQISTCDLSGRSCDSISGTASSTDATVTRSVPMMVGHVDRSGEYFSNGHLRINVHIEFDSGASPGQDIVGGAPGVTIDDRMGDAWILGCAVD